MEISVISVLISGLYAIQASDLIDVVTPDNKTHFGVRGLTFYARTGQSVRISRPPLVSFDFSLVRKDNE